MTQACRTNDCWIQLNCTFPYATAYMACRRHKHFCSKYFQTLYEMHSMHCNFRKHFHKCPSLLPTWTLLPVECIIDSSIGEICAMGKDSYSVEPSQGAIRIDLHAFCKGIGQDDPATLSIPQTAWKLCKLCNNKVTVQFTRHVCRFDIS